MGVILGFNTHSTLALRPEHRLQSTKWLTEVLAPHSIVRVRLFLTFWVKYRAGETQTVVTRNQPVPTDKLSRTSILGSDYLEMSLLGYSHVLAMLNESGSAINTCFSHSSHDLLSIRNCKVHTYIRHIILSQGRSRLILNLTGRA